MFLLIFLAVAFFIILLVVTLKDYDEPHIYKQLLKTQEWGIKRNKILERDNHKCCWCGSKENLQVHHKYYSKYPNNTFVQPWNYPDDALMTLCDKCHKKCHVTKKIKIYYRKYDN